MRDRECLHSEAKMGLEDLSIYASLVSIQASYGVIAVLMKNEISKGRNPLSFAVGSFGLGAFILCPFAFFLEKDTRSNMSLSLLAQVLLISLTGVSAFQTLILMGLRETSPAFSTAMPSLAPAIIFLMAWTLGMEKVDIKRAPSQSKIVGTAICVCGVMAMSFVPGPSLMHLTWPSVTQSEFTPAIFFHIFLQGNSTKRIRGCIYLLAAVVCISCSMILQAKALKKHPAPFTLTVLTSLFGSIEIAILIMVLDKGIHGASWIVDWSGIVIVIYGGMTCHGLMFALQIWCVQKRGPVFVAIFNPVSTVFSALLSSFFMGETLHLGSVIGMLLVFSGLYGVLWGKSKEGVDNKLLSDEEEPLNNAKVDHLHE